MSRSRFILISARAGFGAMMAIVVITLAMLIGNQTASASDTGYTCPSESEVANMVIPTQYQGMVHVDRLPGETCAFAAWVYAETRFMQFPMILDSNFVVSYTELWGQYVPTNVPWCPYCPTYAPAYHQTVVREGDGTAAWGNGFKFYYRNAYTDLPGSGSVGCRISRQANFPYQIAPDGTILSGCQFANN